MAQRDAVHWFRGCENSYGILIPKEFINDATRQTSLFIKYLLTYWKKGDVLNSQLKRGPFDKKDLSVEAYFPKH